MTELFKLGKLVCLLASGYQDDGSYQLEILENQLQCLRDEYLSETASPKERTYQKSKNGSDIDVDSCFLLPAYFALGAILLSIAKFSTSPCDVDDVETHHQTILDSSFHLLETMGGESSAFLPMYLPITLVALHSTSPKRRALASGLLESHQKDTIFKGLSQRIGVSISRCSSMKVDFQPPILTV